MKVLVTGAGGFVGGHLVARLLDEGHDVVAVDRKPAHEWWQVHDRASSWTSRVLDFARSPEVAKFDEVYHLAADMGGIGYITDHLVDCSRNVVDTIALLDSCRGGQRVFFSSSACAYPAHLQSQAAVWALRESDAIPADPEPGYGWEKLYSERLMHYYALERGLVTRVARYHNSYGPNGSWEGGREKAPAALARKFAVAAVTGDRSELEIWGDGEQTRSFMYVDDCVEGTLRIARCDYPHPLNLGSTQLVTINQLADVLEEISGVRFERRRYRLDRPQGVRGRNSDNRLITNVLDWEPTTTLEAGLEATYRWIYDRVAQAYAGGQVKEVDARD